MKKCSSDQSLKEHVLRDHEKRTPYQCQHCKEVKTCLLMFYQELGKLLFNCNHQICNQFTKPFERKALSMHILWQHLWSVLEDLKITKNVLPINANIVNEVSEKSLAILMSLLWEQCVLEDLKKHVLKDHEKRTPYQCQHCTRSFGEVPGNIDVPSLLWEQCVLEDLKEHVLKDHEKIIDNDYIRVK